MNARKVGNTARTAYKPPVKKEAGSFDPYRPLIKEEWDKKIADAEEDARNCRAHNGFDVYVEMKGKYGL